MLHRVSNRASKFFVNRSCFLIDELLLGKLKRNQASKREPPCQTITESAHGMAVSAIRWLGDLSYLASAGPRTP